MYLHGHSNVIGHSKFIYSKKIISVKSLLEVGIAGNTYIRFLDFKLVYIIVYQNHFNCVAYIGADLLVHLYFVMYFVFQNHLLALL